MTGTKKAIHKFTTKTIFKKIHMAVGGWITETEKERATQRDSAPVDHKYDQVSGYVSCT